MERGGLSLKWYLQEITQYLEMRRVETDHLVIEAGDVPEGILAQAKENNCDLTAMSTHGRAGFGRGLLGSVTDAVIRSSDIPVVALLKPSSGSRLIMKPSPSTTYAKWVRNSENRWHLRWTSGCFTGTRPLPSMTLRWRSRTTWWQ